MRRFLITSDKFTGTAELIFNGDGILKRIDATDTNMSSELIAAFKRACPASIEQLQAGGCFGTGTVVVAADFEVSLEDFKREYPYSRNYHLLEKRWEKMSRADQVEAFYAAIEYRKYCNRNSKWYNPKIADSWLANKEYKNDWRKMK